MNDLKEILQQRTPNVNVNPSGDTVNNVNVKSLREVQEIATKLSAKLSAQHNFQLYCGFAWKLPEHVIWRLAEQAIEGTRKKGDPKKLFYWLCTQTMKKAPASR